jgi:hypothetical protein
MKHEKKNRIVSNGRYGITFLNSGGKRSRGTVADWRQSALETVNKVSGGGTGCSQG